MYLPEGVSEAQFLASSDKIVNILASSFTFGYHDVNDIKQEARVLCIEALPRYNPKWSLDAFLYTHVRNRLINFRRDKFRRNDPPCLDCYNSLPGETTHAGGEFCEKYKLWLHRNIAKQNIMNPPSMANINEKENGECATALNSAMFNEALALIDEKLPLELREVYLRMRSGEHVPKAKRLAVEEIIKNIFKENIEA